MVNDETRDGLAPGSGASTSLSPNGDEETILAQPFAPSEVEEPPSHVPERTCILTRATGERGDLIRLAVSPDGLVLPDVRAKAPGRGAWIGVDRAALEQAQAKGKLRGALARAFKGKPLTVPDDLGALIAAALERAFLDRLGLESRSGTVVVGSERIEEAARKGRVHALLHAADAGGDGSRKLDQAWRVGGDREGSGARGVVLPVGRTILAMALGRENVVHVAVVDRAAAGRVSHALARWLGFVGRDGGARPGERIAGSIASPD